MSSFWLLSLLINLTIIPQNPLFEKYTIIPPLGHVKAIATTPTLVCAISDYHLILFNKFDLHIEKTFVFEEEPLLVGYDQFSSDLWIVTTSQVVRITLSSYSIREYTGNAGVTRLGIDDKYLYLDGIEDRALNKRTGMLEPVQGFPGNATWYRQATSSIIKEYAFLTPYFYSDDQRYTDAPFAQYPITAVHEDGMDLYVGTDGYGLLKYNVVSLDRRRVIYGPLDLAIHRIRSIAGHLYFISARGISEYEPKDRSWIYYRISMSAGDILIKQDNLVVGIDNRLSSWNTGVMITMGTSTHDIMTLADDDSCYYIGTRSGMYKMYKGMQDLIAFGPDRFSVNAIHVTHDHIYAGGEYALYEFDRASKQWSKILPFGIKDITQIDTRLYLLSTNNQLLYYSIPVSNDNSDTSWVLLPYFNIYDIAAGDNMVYCASYAGVHYYEPETGLYKVIYNLPRIHYYYISVAQDRILAVAGNALYSLPLKYRD
jgi:hypothetical protein